LENALGPFVIYLFWCSYCIVCCSHICHSTQCSAQLFAR